MRRTHDVCESTSRQAPIPWWRLLFGRRAPSGVYRRDDSGDRGHYRARRGMARRNCDLAPRRAKNSATDRCLGPRSRVPEGSSGDAITVLLKFDTLFAAAGADALRVSISQLVAAEEFAASEGRKMRALRRCSAQARALQAVRHDEREIDTKWSTLEDEAMDEIAASDIRQRLEALAVARNAMRVLVIRKRTRQEGFYGASCGLFARVDKAGLYGRGGRAGDAHDRHGPLSRHRRFKPAAGVEVKHRTTIEYDEGAALRWAIKTGIGLRYELDRRGVRAR